ncbi:MAG: hypothetical protein MPJ50_15320 [Pirellulales bacterium]|nr:hypothetical protein [Pirellulales bacterium]
MTAASEKLGFAELSHSGNPLAAFGDAELTRLAKRNRFEQACHDAGCLLGLVFGMFFCWAALLMLPLGPSHAATFFRITAAVAAFLLAPMAGKIGLGYVADFRGHQYRTELARRYLQLPWKEQLHLTRLSLQAGQAAIALREVAGNSGIIRRCSELRFTSADGQLRAVIGEELDFGRGIAPRDHFRILERMLSAEEAGKLYDICKAADTMKPTKNASWKDELHSEKVQVAIISSDKRIRRWAGHDLEGIAHRASEEAWGDLLKHVCALLPAKDS